MSHRAKAVLLETQHVQKGPNYQPDLNHQPKQAKQEEEHNHHHHHHHNPNHHLFRSLQKYRNHQWAMGTVKSYLLTPG